MTDNRKDNIVNMILSGILVAAFFAYVICCLGIWYRTNDDAIISNISFGSYGPDRVHLVYVNIIYGMLLRALFFINENLNWFYAVTAFPSLHKRLYPDILRIETLWQNKRTVDFRIAYFGIWQQRFVPHTVHPDRRFGNMYRAYGSV